MDQQTNNQYEDSQQENRTELFKLENIFINSRQRLWYQKMVLTARLTYNQHQEQNKITLMFMFSR